MIELNRKNDVLFKRIFGSENSKDVLARFLTVVLEIPIEADELTILQTELTPEFIADKNTILDIQVRSSKSHDKMNIEMQLTHAEGLDRRIIYYWSRAFAGELKTGQRYTDLPKQISIIIADFVFFDYEDKEKYHGIYQILEKDEKVIFTDALVFHILEIPKLSKLERKKTALENWLLYLDNARGGLLEEIANAEPMIKKAITIEEAFRKSDEERYMYELREKGRHDFENAMLLAEDRGMEKGMEKTKISIARSMLSKGMSLDDVVSFTGLSIEELKKL